MHGQNNIKNMEDVKANFEAFFFLNKRKQPAVPTGVFRHQKLGKHRFYPLESSSNRLGTVFLCEIPILTLSSITQLPGGASTVRFYIN